MIRKAGDCVAKVKSCKEYCRTIKRVYVDRHIYCSFGYWSTSLKHTESSQVYIENICLFSLTLDAEYEKCIDDLADVLKTVYLSKHCRKQLYPWKSEHFVDLHTIYVNLTMDIEIPQPSRPIKQRLKFYHTIFDADEDNRRFVLEGRPGLGKTTICAKIAYDWSHRLKFHNSPLNHIKLLFLLRLGLINHQTSIEEAIFDQLLPSGSTSYTWEELRKVIEMSGKSVIIVLDALDEADPKLFEKKQSQEAPSIVKIMQFQDLPKCRVLVTTRPWRVAEIMKCEAYRRLELQPFTKSDIVQYVEKFFGQNIELSAELEESIKENKLIVDASIPLIALLICWYWQMTEGKEEIPMRLGQLYSGIIDTMCKSLSAEKQGNVMMVTLRAI